MKGGGGGGGGEEPREPGKLLMLRFERFYCQFQNSSGELGDVGDGGRSRCLDGKTLVLAPPSVLGAWSMALGLWLPFEYYYCLLLSYAAISI